MGVRPGRDVLLQVRSLTVELGPAGISQLCCLECQNPLDVHQPAADMPDQMLGTCNHCHCWYLIEESITGDQAHLITLPSLVSMHRADGAMHQPASAAPRSR